ncbi:MAG: hypothetical protein M0C28_11290 [Candidatus Moduliflexus flocculans]|nr:hypothetical protein [Candidatus Moduliflexus flocculans]
MRLRSSARESRHLRHRLASRSLARPAQQPRGIPARRASGVKRRDPTGRRRQVAPRRPAA